MTKEAFRSTWSVAPRQGKGSPGKWRGDTAGCSKATLSSMTSSRHSHSAKDGTFYTQAPVQKRLKIRFESTSNCLRAIRTAGRCQLHRLRCDPRHNTAHAHQPHGPLSAAMALALNDIACATSVEHKTSLRPWCLTTTVTSAFKTTWLKQ